ncbi:hypothetical protein FRB99_007450 [Tulasnella sp. 403]|nr:hypothetical protein FRB99_007450 [Tulasnella sp. 403]
MSFLSFFVNSAKIVSVGGSGLMTGYCFAASNSGIPGLYAGDLSSKQLVRSWNYIYTRGAKLAVPTVLISTFAYFFTADSSKYLPQTSTIFGWNRSAQLVLAGLVLFSALPYTGIVMLPGIRKLQATAEAFDAEDSAREPSPEDERKVRQGVQAWSRANDFRAFIFGTSFFLGLTALM